MAGLLKLIAKGIVAGAFFALLGSCVTYPYQTSFAACDTYAGQCYRDCEVYEGSADYGACHADCEYDADQCFADAYGPNSSGYGPGYPSPWYGRYGAWYPQTGFVFSYSNRYGYHRYRGRRYRDRGHDDDDHGGPGGGNQGSGNSGGNHPTYTQRYPRTGDPVEPGYNSGDGVGQRNNRSLPRQQGSQGGGSQGSSGNSGSSGVTSQNVAPSAPPQASPPPSRSSGEDRSEPHSNPRNEGEKQPQ